MSKKDRISNLGVFIGLKVAHEILLKFTRKEESIPHLESEIDNYDNLLFALVDGNWNEQDIEEIKEVAIKRAVKKLGNYRDIKDEKYNLIEELLERVLGDLELCG